MASAGSNFDNFLPSTTETLNYEYLIRIKLNKNSFDRKKFYRNSCVEVVGCSY